MGVFEYFVIYVMSWWVLLFVVLPFKSGAPVSPDGAAYHAAPARSYLKAKLWITSALALLVTLVLSYLINQGYFELWMPYRF